MKGANNLVDMLGLVYVRDYFSDLVKDLCLHFSLSLCSVLHAQCFESYSFSISNFYFVFKNTKLFSGASGNRTVTGSTRLLLVLIAK